ncbi:hypothetical protein OEZ86_010927 [Tetradesmus obliquus]|nr:hypothetical protein OEZ86_010927 [Tetradesmus obliquus]
MMTRVVSSKQFSSYTAAAAGMSRNRLESLKPDEVYYFAFGSNMNPSVLTGRRMVQPRQSWPCCVPSHRLSFGVQGLPYSEPGFATIVEVPQQEQQQQQWQRQQLSPQQQQQQQQQPCVHGVIHRITRREWAYVKATEGVGSKRIGYQVIPVDCHLYDGTVVQALTLQAAAASLHMERRVLPSQRYLNLLQEGARHHQLDTGYQQWLATLQPYRPSSMQKMLGTAVSGAVLLAAAAPAVPVYVAGRAMGVLPGPERGAGLGGAQRRASQDSGLQEASTSSTQTSAVSSSSSSSSSSRGVDDESSSSRDGGLLPFMSWYMNQAQSWTWFVHDAAIKPVLGSGCSNEQEA